jgi:hypothetical protein
LFCCDKTTVKNQREENIFLVNKILCWIIWINTILQWYLPNNTSKLILLYYFYLSLILYWYWPGEFIGKEKVSRVKVICACFYHDNIIIYFLVWLSIPLFFFFNYRLWYVGQWFEICVDDRLPCDEHRNLMFSKSSTTNEFWGPLLEKAFAISKSQRKFFVLLYCIWFNCDFY